MRILVPRLCFSRHIFFSRISDVIKKRRSTKRVGRSKSNHSLTDDGPTCSAKKPPPESFRTRSATFSSMTSVGSAGSSKSSFFSSFAPRWGKSQSYAGTSPMADKTKVYSLKEFILCCKNSDQKSTVHCTPLLTLL